MLQKLVTEAGHQQEAVDVLLDRGRRYLHHRACITLEVDLENLAFLWNSYTKQLFLLHDQQDIDLSDLQSLAAGDGKENIQLHSTPIKWRKGTKGAPEKLQFSETLDKNHTPVFSPERNGTADSIPNPEKLNSPFVETKKCKVAQPNPDQSNNIFGEQREAPLESQPSFTAEACASATEDKAEESEKKIQLEAFAQEASGIDDKEDKKLSPKTKRVLPQIPPTPLRSKEADAKEAKDQGEDIKVEVGKKLSSPPRSPRSRVIAVSQWPAESKTGWLKVAGEGIFSSSVRQQRLADSLAFGGLTQSDPAPSSNNTPGRRRSPDAQLFIPAGESQADTEASIVPVSAARVQQAANGIEGLLGKRSKELHNELQQKQQRQEIQQSRQPGCPDSEPDVRQLQKTNGGENGEEESGALQLQLGLTASEENLKMEIEEALKEINGSLMDTSTADSLPDLSASLLDASKSSTMDTSAKTSDDELLCPDDPDHPTGPKRRRMNTDTPSSVSSCSDSPLISGDNSMSGTPTSSPAGTLPRDFKQRYKKDELWKAIESNYEYLMDKEIIETCQVGKK